MKIDYTVTVSIRESDRWTMKELDSAVRENMQIGFQHGLSGVKYGGAKRVKTDELAAVVAERDESMVCVTELKTVLGRQVSHNIKQRNENKYLIDAVAKARNERDVLSVELYDVKVKSQDSHFTIQIVSIMLLFSVIINLVQYFGV